jgi:para-nitrobenzyl esterase
MNAKLARYVISLLMAAALFAVSERRAEAQSTRTAQTGISSPVVKTEHGPVRGVVTPAARKFLGVRYAAPPTGQRRWQPPVVPTRWTLPANATAFGNHCPQVPSPFGTPSTNEDCLFLNVFTPPLTSLVRRPVMLWIHGGALHLGQSEDYDPTPLVKQGVVVVTINYRLGALGFMAHPELSAASTTHTSGNYGLMDQQFALKWVQRNIANFGGNPDNVTIFGQSAGGLSVHAHMTSPASRGLFDQAIVQSGGITLDPIPLATAEALGRDIATRAGCTSQSLSCLRSLSVEQLLANQLPPGAIGFFPNLDNNVLPRTFRSAFTSGNFNRTPVIEGSTHDEWSLFVALTELQNGGPLPAEFYPQAIGATLGISAEPVIAAIMAQYPLSNYASPSAALTAVGTDAIFGCNAYTASKLLSKYVTTYSYEFNDSNPPQYILPPVSFPYGAYHASEVQFLMGVRPNLPAPPFTANQQALSGHMVRYWAQFARSGNPNVIGSPAWIRFNGTESMQSLVPATPKLLRTFATDHKCGFWAALAAGG